MRAANHARQFRIKVINVMRHPCIHHLVNDLPASKCFMRSWERFTTREKRPNRCMMRKGWAIMSTRSERTSTICLARSNVFAPRIPESPTPPQTGNGREGRQKELESRRAKTAGRIVSDQAGDVTSGRVRQTADGARASAGGAMRANQQGGTERAEHQGISDYPATRGRDDACGFRERHQGHEGGARRKPKGIESAEEGGCQVTHLPECLLLRRLLWRTCFVQRACPWYTARPFGPPRRFCLESCGQGSKDN